MKKFISIIVFISVLLIELIPFSVFANEEISDSRHGVAMLGMVYKVDSVSIPEFNMERVSVAEAQTRYTINEEYEYLMGTCFFVGAENKAPQYFLTNHHVVENFIKRGQGELFDWNIAGDDSEPIILHGRASLRVIFSKNDYEDAFLIDYNENHDVALLKLKEPTNKRMSLPLCLPDERIISKEVYAIGFPGISENLLANPVSKYSEKDTTVTSGVASRILTRTGTGTKMVQTDCKINFGNSGGPLFNDENDVIGIISLFVHYDNVNPNGTSEIEKDYVYYGFSIEHAIDIMNEYNVEYNLVEYGESKTTTTTEIESNDLNDNKETALNKKTVIILISLSVLIIGFICIFTIYKSKKNKKN